MASMSDTMDVRVSMGGNLWDLYAVRSAAEVPAKKLLLDPSGIAMMQRYPLLPRFPECAEVELFGGTRLLIVFGDEDRFPGAKPFATYDEFREAVLAVRNP